MATHSTTLKRSQVGIFDDSRIHGHLEIAQVDCPVCGKVHGFENQGLRWVGIGCGHVHFATLDDLIKEIK